MRRNFFFLLLITAFGIGFLPASGSCESDTIRVATWNTLNFPDAQGQNRIRHFQRVLGEIQPDIIVCQEISNQDGADIFHEQIVDPDEYSIAEFVDGDWTDSILLFKTAKVDLVEVSWVETEVRLIMVYSIRLDGQPENMPPLHVSSCHLKAGSSRNDRQLRHAQADRYIRHVRNELDDQYVMLCGDYNMRSSNEEAFQTLIERDEFHDPIDRLGSWNDNAEFADIHTQSPRTERLNDGGSNGGMDDRFDIILLSNEFAEDGPWYYLENTYTAFGNDGRHFNRAIHEGGNDAVDMRMADALHNASDHLPVFLELVYDPGQIIDDITVSLEEGWNMISINVIPPEEFWIREEGPDIIRLTERLRVDEDLHHIMIMKDFAGRFYIPHFDFCNIPYWDLTQGYMMKVDRDVETEFFGEPIPGSEDIPLRENWNMIAYFPRYELDASRPDFYVLSPIIDHVERAKDGAGDFMVPRLNFSNMDPWRESQGYQVKVNQELIFNYPDEQREARCVSDLTGGHDLDFELRTDNCMSILIQGVEGVSVEAGDAAAAYSIDGKKMGFGQFDNDGRCGAAVWGDDKSTAIKDGLLPGESFELYLQEQSGEEPIPLRLNRTIEGEGLIYRTNGLSVVEMRSVAEPPQHYYIAGSNPNPFNSTTRISYGLPEASDVKLRIYDGNGKLIETVLDAHKNAGVHSIAWNAKSRPSGIYYARISTGEFQQSVKMLMVK